ncbi:MAG: hypothetical protein AAGA80_13180 [Cyanobacteria bacterium P01_F01_bin.143]
MRKLQLPKIFTGLAILVAVGGITTPTNAFTLTSFSDRESWESAVGGDVSEEDFNSYESDTAFNRADLNVGDFILNGVGHRQIIDSPNDGGFEVPSFSVDGTQMILGHTDSDSYFTITFNSPITAFGADFDDITSQGATELSAGSNPVGTIPLNTEFLGFIADESFTTLTFRSANDGFDGFGIDNFIYVFSNESDVPVTINENTESPEPTIFSSPTFSNRTIPGFETFSPVSPVTPFAPEEFSPAYRNTTLTFDNIQNVPFRFSPTIGLIGVGGIWVISRLRKKKLSD